MDDDRDRFSGAEDLEEPAGRELPGWQGITPRTTRRQEELDRLMDDPSSGGIQPPGDGNVDNRNRAATEEDLVLTERMEGLLQDVPARGPHPPDGSGGRSHESGQDPRIERPDTHAKDD